MKRIAAYFSDLLATLKRIEQHLALLASCVHDNPDRQGYGRKSIKTQEWFR